RVQLARALRGRHPGPGRRAARTGVLTHPAERPPERRPAVQVLSRGRPCVLAVAGGGGGGGPRRGGGRAGRRAGGAHAGRAGARTEGSMAVGRTYALPQDAWASWGWLRSPTWDLTFVSLSAVLVALPYACYSLLTGVGLTEASSASVVDMVVTVLVGGPH